MKRMRIVLIITVMVLMMTSCGKTNTVQNTSLYETENEMVETAESDEQEEIEEEPDQEEENTDEKKVYGTWQLTHVLMEGVEYTVEEIDAMGDDSLNDFYLVFKAGGIVGGFIQDESDTMEYTVNGNVVEMGIRELILDGETLVMDGEDDSKVYFDKISDSQLFISPVADKYKVDDSDDTNQEETEDTIISDGIDPEFKEAMDKYEEFFDEYVEFMKKYKESTDTSEMMDDYLDYMEDYAETMEALEDIEDEELTDEELKYYTDTMLRINKKLLEAY